MTDMSDSEPEHEISPTAHLLDEIALYGYRPFSDEADPRPLPRNAWPQALSPTCSTPSSPR
jgi:hypothetical protein